MTPSARRTVAAMTESALAIDILEPGERADELLAAIAAELHLEKIDPHGEPYVQVIVELDWDEGFRLAEQALDDAGDEDRDIVSVRYRT